MFVFLKYDGTVKKISDITIQDCHKPRVGQCIEERIDPALWYKVLVLKAIFVDCDQRCIFWTVDDDADQACQSFEHSEETVTTDYVPAFLTTSEKLLSEDCYDFDPNIDELFDTALQVFNRWDKESLPSQENLLKMLHVYILPQVKFSRKYADQIKMVLNSIEVQHEDVEDKIQKKDMTKKNTEISLRKQRERILKNEDFSRTSYIATLSEKFLKVFLQHLEKDIRKMNEEFVHCESEVEQLRGSFKSKERKKLTENRTMRDSIYEELQKAIGAREEIKNVISRKNVKKSKKKSKRRSCHTVFHEVYMEVATRLQNMNKEIQNLINVKIRLSSVREAVILSLKELENDGETFGYNRKKGSFEIEADLYDPHNKPEEWATLEERVKVFLKVKQAGFRPKFEKFCSTVLDKCQSLFDDSQLFSIKFPDSPESTTPPPISPSTAMTLNLVGSASVNRRSKQVSTVPVNCSRSFAKTRQNIATTYTSRWSLGTIPRESCEKICQDVIEHLWDTAMELATEIKHEQNEIPHSFICKVYICYEEHVSSKLMPMLNELYERSYRENCESLSKWIERTPMADFGFGEHVVANVLNIVSSGSSSENSSREGSSDIEEAVIEEVVAKNPDSQFTKSLSNKSFKDMTLEQLYNYCDKQSESLPPLYCGMIDNGDAMNGRSSSDDNTDQNETHRKELYTVSESSGNGLIANGVEIGTECKSNDSSYVVVPHLGSDENETHDYVMESEIDLRNTATMEVTLRQKPQQSPTPPTNNSQLPVTVQQFCEHFKDFEKFIEDENEACTLFQKLRVLTHTLKYIEHQISGLRKDQGVCSDDLLDIIIMLLCHIRPDMLLKLYSHLNLLLHLRPNFMEGSAHDYALITFSGAFQHLVEQKMLSKGATNASS